MEYALFTKIIQLKEKMKVNNKFLSNPIVCNRKFLINDVDEQMLLEDGSIAIFKTQKILLDDHDEILMDDLIHGIDKMSFR